MHASHPLGVPGRQIVVDGDDVDPLSGEGVQVDRHRRDQRLALTGLHLGDHAPVQRTCPEHLHVEVPLLQHPLGGLSDHRVRLDLEVVERLPRLEATAELVGLGAQLGVALRLHLGFQRVDRVHQSSELFEDAALASLEDPLQD